ncbi:MAG TPA: hypothetical protein VET46_00155 [Steroidobacteraceae bacterium]|nr:hypothetical protein [Steroidobacteraceae bacterium]
MKMRSIRRLWPFSKGDTVSQPVLARPGDADLRGKDIAALAAMLRGATPGATVQLEDIFVAPRLNPKEHEWYYGARCRWCHRTAAALHDPNEGQTRLAFAGRGEIHFHCHHCNGLLKATVPQIVWFEFDG